LPGFIADGEDDRVPLEAAARKLSRRVEAKPEKPFSIETTVLSALSERSMRVFISRKNAL
jgi:hypothetical protein